MPKKRTAAVGRDRNGVGLEPWSRGRKGPNARPLFNPASPEALAALKRTLDHTPEVMVKVTGGGRDVGTAQAHIAYIDRHGILDIHTDDGDRLNGKDVAQALVEDWNLDQIIPKKHRPPPAPGTKDTRAKLVHNIVLSMHSGTPPAAVLAAAQQFARENFALSHRYAMVLHDPATDPKHEKTQSGKNPHVHLVVKAVSEEGERLYIRKDTLRLWREQFAKALRAQGIAANATPAAIRGKPKSSAKGAIHQHQGRLETWRTSGPMGARPLKQPIPSELLQIRVERILDEIVNRVEPDPAGKQQLAATRDNVVKGWLATEQALRSQGLNQEADRVLGFVNNLPPVKTAHDQLRETLLADPTRLYAALDIKPPAVDKATPTPGDGFTLER